MLKPALRAADVARPGLVDAALRAATNVDVARAHDADVRGPARVRANAAGTRDRHFGVRCLHCARIDVARSGDVVVGALGLPGACLDAARACDGQLHGLHVDGCEADAAGPGDRAFEAVALDL